MKIKLYRKKFKLISFEHFREFDDNFKKPLYIQGPAISPVTSSGRYKNDIMIHFLIKLNL